MYCAKDTRGYERPRERENGIQEDSLGEEALFLDLEGWGGRVVRSNTGYSFGFEFQKNNEYISI